MIKLTPMRDKVLVHNMSRGERKIGSIVVRDDDGKTFGIRPRWAQVYAVGEDITEVAHGQWVLIEHGRWTRTLSIQEPGMEKPLNIWAIDRFGIIAVTDDQPQDEIIGEE